VAESRRRCRLKSGWIFRRSVRAFLHIAGLERGLDLLKVVEQLHRAPIFLAEAILDR